jgi:ketosteroid isomerase-like protein
VSKARPTPAETAIQHANESFYAAFSRGDYDAMARVWAAEAPLSCVHPGLPAIVGREAVMSSWRQILSEGTPLEMRCDYAQVHLYGETAIVNCYEANGEQPAHLAATNVFIFERADWRMVHHHAGPLARTIARPAADGGGGGLN